MRNISSLKKRDNPGMIILVLASGEQNMSVVYFKVLNFIKIHV